MTTTDPRFPHDDSVLFARLRRMWNRRDPVPNDLVDSVLVALATEGLVEEYALLTMLETGDRLAGVRGGGDDASRHTQVFEFADGTVTVMLRVSALNERRRRVDGWLAPARPISVVLQHGDEEWTASVSAEGRFEFNDVPAGSVRLLLRPDAGGRIDDTARQGFATPQFDL
ncbi:hypothetical protein [Lacisediminihabitans sp.]|jgi:hypothetical protein|uniref:hypothetical protein n=1 Tax=Lacisediminihabitans sp. TaxID=2787631 RepID=UPI002F941C5D